MRFQYSIALAALIGSSPVIAQSTNGVSATQQAQPATPAQSPPAPAPAPATTPAPTGNAVGPPQLRDFSLGGTVTRPAETPATQTAPGSTVPTAEQPTLRARSTAERAVRSTVRLRPPAPAAGPSVSATVPLAPETVAPATEPSLLAPPSEQDVAAPAPAPEPAPASSLSPAATPIWPWLAALFALVAGGAFLWWRHQQRGQERYASDHADLGALVMPRAMPEPTPAPPQRQPARPAPVPASTRTVPTPAPMPTPAPPLPSAAPPAAPLSRAPVSPAGVVTSSLKAQAPAPSVPPVTPVAPAPLGIVASGLKPRLEIELVPILAEVDAAQGAAMTVELLITNRGSAPARDVTVEALLVNADAEVNAAVGSFFRAPAGGGDPVAMIKPMGSIKVTMRVGAQASSLAPIAVEGRRLLVPMVAVNAHYRGSGATLTESASFIIGRGDAEAEKLAPFRLDIGARRWTGLAARPHSSGLTPA